MTRTFATLAAATLLGVPAGAAAQERPDAARGIRYTFAMQSSEDAASTGTVMVLGRRARIDMDRGSKARVGRKKRGVTFSQDEGDYLLVDHGAGRLQMVDPGAETYHDMELAKFTGMVGTVMSHLDKVMTMEVSDHTVRVDRVGDGGAIAGLPTERWAITQEFTTRIGMMGQTGRELHRVVTDYWIAPDVALPPNPLFELMQRGEMAIAQGNPGFVRAVEKSRGMLPKGGALRVVVTSASSDLDDGEVKPAKTQRMEITSIEPTRVDAQMLRVPRGYERKEMKFELPF